MGQTAATPGVRSEAKPVTRALAAHDWRELGPSPGVRLEFLAGAEVPPFVARLVSPDMSRLGNSDPFSPAPRLPVAKTIVLPMGMC
jgi:hypothetical protein